jgi:hypothetical protein
MLLYTVTLSLGINKVVTALNASEAVNQLREQGYRNFTKVIMVGKVQSPANSDSDDYGLQPAL